MDWSGRSRVSADLRRRFVTGSFLLSLFFKYCLFHEHITHNPILSVPQFRIAKARGTAETLSADQVAKLMLDLETYRGQETKTRGWWGTPGCLVPYFALTLFAGIRPDWQTGEIGRILPSHINLDTDVIMIEPTVSKINEKRTIKLQPNLRLWLERYPIKEYMIIPDRRFSAMLRDIRKRHDLGHDVLRHTYISMLVGAFRSVGDASLQAGNSEAIIRRHYLDLKSTEEADAFWRITPAGTNLPDPMEKKDGRFVLPEVNDEKAIRGGENVALVSA
jgi:integrase